MLRVKLFRLAGQGFYGARVLGGGHVYTRFELGGKVMNTAVAQHFCYLREIVVVFADIGFCAVDFQSYAVFASSAPRFLIKELF